MSDALPPENAPASLTSAPSTPAPSTTTTATTAPAAKTPWYLHVVVGVGVWIGAAILSFGFGAILTVIDSWVLFLLCSIPLLTVSFFLCRMPPAVFKPHLIFSLSLAGQTCLIYAIHRAFDPSDDTLLEIVLVMQVVVFVVLRDFAHRIATAALVTSLMIVAPWPTWAVQRPELLFVAQVLVVVVSLGLRQHPSIRAFARHDLVRPLAWCSVVTAPMLSMFVLFQTTGMSPTVHAVVLGVILIGFLVVVANTLKTSTAEDAVKTKLKLGIGLAVVVTVLLLTRGNVALILALILFGVGHQNRTKAVEAIGVLLLIFGLVFTYYSLDTSLMMKSLAVVGTGVGLLVAAAFTNRLLGATTTRSPVRFMDRRAHSKDKFMMALAGGLVCLVIGGLCVQKEVHKRTGDVVVLELRPRDPRSIMQGDYMRLATAMVNAVRDNLPDGAAPNEEGYVVVAADENGVAQFVRLQDDLKPRAENETVLEYKRRERKVRIGPTEFFFEEGRGKHFATARYAQMRANASGKLLLEKLLDAKRNAL